MTASYRQPAPSIPAAAAVNGRAQHASSYMQVHAARFGTPGQISADQDVDALHHAAKAYQAAHPGTDYVEAVKAVQYLG